MDDIVLVKYQQQVSKDRFHLGRVLRTIPDQHQRVRTVIVGVRDRRKAVRERREVCRSGIVEMTLPIQRLVVILPSGETWGQGETTE